MYPPVGPPTRSTPGTVIGLRVLVGLQLAGVALALVLLLVLSVFAGSGLDSSDDLTRGFAGVGVFLGILSTALALAVAASLGIPLVLIRGNRPRGCTASLIVLVVVESVAALLGVFAIIGAAVNGDPGQALLQLLFLLVPVGVIVLAMVPVTRAWAAPPPVATWNGPPGPAYGPDPQYGPPPTWGGPPPAW